MYNSDQSKLADLPSTARLLRSTVIAAVSALFLLITVVLPAEYAVDPTGIGRVLGLTEMGEIKQELADEAEQDRLNPDAGESSSLLNDLFGLFVGTAHAQEAWDDTVTFTLEPGAFAEVKMVMTEGDTVEYNWATDGGRINFDLHAHGGSQSIDYDRGRGETAGEGRITAPFAGEHGWFWRNRDSAAVTVTLQLRGTYAELIQKD